jgi:peptidyl-prolyl cis-trans isomerase A (cyclophilin A)
LEPRATIHTTKGDIVAEIDLEMVPITAQNFLNLSQSGFYAGTKFHRISKGFVIQGGDPNTKSTDTSKWGYGGPGYTIPDEFHPALRHNASGVLSMATSGPDTGGSQFFITLRAAPELDDRHSVFGHVLSGMDVVQAIEAGAIVGGSNDGRPVDPVTITNITIQMPTMDPALVHRSALLVPIIGEKASDGHSNVTFAMVVRNTGTVRDTITLTANAPAGWTSDLENPAPQVPAGTSRVVLVTFHPPAAGFDQPATLSVRGAPTNGGNPALAFMFADKAALGTAPTLGHNVTADYVGFLEDGRVFDTSIATLFKDTPDLITMASVYRNHSSYAPITFQVGKGVVQGFSNLALATRVNQTGVARLPFAQAYPSGDMYKNALVHRNLLFEMHVVGTS